MQTSKRPTWPDLILLLIARSIPKNSLADRMVVHCRVTLQHFFKQYAFVDRGEERQLMIIIITGILLLLSQSNCLY